MVDDEVLGFVGDDIGNVFICPKGRLATGHPADAGNAVDNRIVMSLAGFQFYQFRIFFSCGPIANFMVITYCNGIIRIKSIYTPVLYKYTRYAVNGSGDDIFVAETYILCIGFDETIEVSTTFRTEPQVPFSDGCCGVSFCLKHVSHGDTGCINDKF